MPIPNGGLITETNRQYYAGAQQFTVPATAVNQTFTSTFDTNLVVGSGNYADPGSIGYNVNNFKIFTSANAQTWLELTPASTDFDATANGNSNAGQAIVTITANANIVGGSIFSLVNKTTGFVYGVITLINGANTQLTLNQNLPVGGIPNATALSVRRITVWQMLSQNIITIPQSLTINTYVKIELTEPAKENNFGSDDLEVVLDEIKNILEDPLKAKVGHNIKFDMYVLKRFDIVVQGVAFDTMIAAHLLNPSAKSISLDSLSLEHLNHETIKIEELIGKGKNQIPISHVTLDQTSFYASENADISLQLAKTLKARLKDNTLYEFFKTIELSLLPVLANMEYNGVFVDSNMLMTMSKDTGRKLDILKAKIFDIAGKDFNVNSTQQLANILFDELELPQIKKRSTAEEVLKKLRPHHELPALILEYRKYYKLKNTYLDSLQELINNNTSRIHSTFNQTIASTGRLSSTNPNFQNIPIRTDEGREIRKSFIAQDNNWKILSADYSQVELRMMAHFSKDNGLIEAFNNSEDIHSKTASLVFNVPIEMVQPEMRRTAKVVNFGIMYGAGAFRISQELGISRKEASLLIDNYFAKYPGIRRYIDSTCSMAREKKYVETILGRRRPIWDADSENGLRRQAAERMAINMPIQGSAAEMIKLAMINIHEEMSRLNLRSKMVLQIHDELIFEFPFEEQELLLKLVIDKMEGAMKLSVPIIVDYGIGRSWYEAH